MTPPNADPHRNRALRSPMSRELDAGGTYGTDESTPEAHHSGGRLRRVPRVIGFRPHSALTVTVADCEGLVEAIGKDLP